MNIIRSFVLLLCAILAPLGCAQANTATENSVGYTVQNGDTLGRIARDKFGTNDFLSVAKANNIANPNRIYPGMVLHFAGTYAEVANAPTSHTRSSGACANETPPSQVGIASWYGGRDGYHGKKTASGEKYDMHAHTAAHPTLPFGTMVCVSNPANGKSVLARINDRGPFKYGRIIDVSYRIATELGIARAGTALVQVSTISTPSPKRQLAPRTAVSLRKAPEATHGDYVVPIIYANDVLRTNASDTEQLNKVVRELEDLAGPPYDVLPLALTIMARQNVPRPNVPPLLTTTGDFATEFFRLSNTRSTTKE